MRTGDLLRLKSVPMEINNGIELSGHVQNPGSVAWRPGLRIADVLRSVADVEKVLGVAALGAIPAGGEVKGKTRARLGLPAWMEPGFLLIFLVGMVIGAAIGAVIVALL